MGTAASVGISLGMAEASSFMSDWVSGQELIGRVVEGDLIEFNRDIFQHWGVYIQRTEGISFIIHLSGGDGDDLSYLSNWAVAETTNSLPNPSASIVHKFVPSVSGPAGAIAQVRCDNLIEVAQNSVCRVNNGRDARFQPYTSEEIIARALNQLGHQKYHLLFTNCEHFSTWCRYGSKSSNQSSRFKSVVFGTAAAAMTGSAGVGLAAGVACLAACSVGNQIRNKVSRHLELNWY